MKVNRIKIDGALCELRTSKSNVRHLVSEALSGEMESIKGKSLDRLNTLFDGLEEYLIILMNADLARKDV